MGNLCSGGETVKQTYDMPGRLATEGFEDGSQQEIISDLIKKSKMLKNKLTHIKDGFTSLIEKVNHDVIPYSVICQANLTSEIRSYISNSKSIASDLEEWTSEATDKLEALEAGKTVQDSDIKSLKRIFKEYKEEAQNLDEELQSMKADQESETVGGDDKETVVKTLKDKVPLYEFRIDEINKRAGVFDESLKQIRKLLSTIMNFNEFDSETSFFENLLDETNELTPELKQLKHNLIQARANFDVARQILDDYSTTSTSKIQEKASNLHVQLRSADLELASLEEKLADLRKQIGDCKISELIETKRVLLGQIEQEINELSSVFGRISVTMVDGDLKIKLDVKMNKLRTKLSEVHKELKKMQQDCGQIDLKTETPQILLQKAKNLQDISDKHSQMQVLYSKTDQMIRDYEEKTKQSEISQLVDIQVSKFDKLQCEFASQKLTLKNLQSISKQMVDYASEDEERRTQDNNLKLIKLESKYSKIEKVVAQLQNDVQNLKQSQSSQKKADLIKIVNNLQIEQQKVEEMVKEFGEKIEAKTHEINVRDFLLDKIRHRQKECDRSHEIVAVLIEKGRKVKKLYNKKSDSNISSKDREILLDLKKKVSQTKDKLSFFQENQKQLVTFLEEIKKQSKDESKKDDGLIELVKMVSQMKAKWKNSIESGEQYVKKLKILKSQLKEIKEIKEESKVHSRYEPIEGDDDDRLMAQFVNSKDGTGSDVRRITRGTYLIGNKKVKTKVKDDQLYVLIGTSTMSIDEYMTSYKDKENRKGNRSNSDGSSSISSSVKSFKTDPRKMSPGMSGSLAGSTSQRDLNQKALSMMDTDLTFSDATKTSRFQRAATSRISQKDGSDGASKTGSKSGRFARRLTKKGTTITPGSEETKEK